MDAERLVAMANQIGQFFASQPHADAPALIADHLRRFWEPRMRAGILALAPAQAERLQPVVREAVARLAAHQGSVTVADRPA